jgi:hypothetical protein
MKLKIRLMIVALAAAIPGFSQDPVATQYGNTITPADLKENLSILASDAMEGRETGKRGQKMAAAFIRAHFEELGLTGPVDGQYYQPVELYTSIPGDVYLSAAGKKYVNFEEVLYYGNSDSNGEISLPVIFAGKGKAEDFNQIDATGKAVLIKVNSEDNFRGPLETAREKGAKLVLFYNPNAEEFKQLLGQFKSYLSGGSLSVNKPTPAAKAGVFFISPTVAEKVLNTTIDKLEKAASAEVKKAALKKFKGGNIAYKVGMDVKTLRTENVLGFMEGTDKKDEILVITSHYDHIGKRRSGEGDLINNGADDDGSGTVSVMQLAKAFALAKKDGKGPRRSILFMTVTGEEKGLLGSDYYTQHPIFPLQNTVVDLNIDMVGRRDPQHKDTEPYVYVIGSDKLSTELHKINEAQNKTYTNLIFDYTYNDQNHPERLYYRSDHWNFAKNNIPIVFYFDGIHEDYHKPTDEVSKIEFDLLAKRAQCVFYTAWEIANREQRIMPDQQNATK